MIRKRCPKRGLWAVDHAKGISLVKASTGKRAIAKVQRELGEAGGPYRISKNQMQSIAWARAMGAKIIGGAP